MLRVHAAIEPVNGNHAAARSRPVGGMEGGQQAVAVIQRDQHLLAGIGRRRVMAQEMADRLQIAADPGKALAAKGRDHVTGVIADKSHHRPRQ